jgi:hypothetical protein
VVSAAQFAVQQIAIYDAVSETDKLTFGSVQSGTTQDLDYGVQYVLVIYASLTHCTPSGNCFLEVALQCTASVLWSVDEMPSLSIVSPQPECQPQA